MPTGTIATFGYIFLFLSLSIFTFSTLFSSKQPRLRKNEVRTLATVSYVGPYEKGGCGCSVVLDGDVNRISYRVKQTPFDPRVQEGDRVEVVVSQKKTILGVDISVRFYQTSEWDKLRALTKVAVRHFVLKICAAMSLLGAFLVALGALFK